MEVFSEKQKEFLSDLKNDRLKRINIFQGAVSSGKTYISLIGWVFWVTAQKEKTGYLMVGNTLDTLKTNCLDVLLDIFGEENFKYSIGNRKALIFDKEIILRGADDEGAEKRVRGVTLKGAYLDEVTLMPESFFNMTITRLRKKNAKLFGTTNPDRANHWLKVNFLDKAEEKNLKNYFYSIDDNIFLEKEYIRDMKNMFSGVFHDRFIKGFWVNAEGLIYTDFVNNYKKFLLNKEFVINNYKFSDIYLGLDFGGNRSDNSICAIGLTTNKESFDKIIVLKSKKFKGNIGTSELREIVKDFILEIQYNYKKTDIIFCDNNESMIIHEIRNYLGERQKEGVKMKPVDILVKNATKKEIKDRIQFTSTMINQERILFVENDTQDLINALSTALWDTKPNSKKDTRLDNFTTDIDSLDAFEYTFENYMKMFNLGGFEIA